MEVLDYGRSFLHAKNPNNPVRFWIESRTRVMDEHAGAEEDFYQCAACKEEDGFRHAC